MKSSLTKLALKVSVFVVGIGASTSLFSNPSCPFDGFYVGGMGGYLQPQTEFSAKGIAEFRTFAQDRFGFISSKQKDVKVYHYHGGGALNFGYGQQIGKCMFLAGEIFVSWADRETSLKNFASSGYGDPDFDRYEVSLRTKTSASLQKTEFAIDLRPGFIFDSCTLLYGRVGVGFNRLRTRNAVDFEYNSVETVFSPPFEGHSIDRLSKTKKDRKAVLRLGVGGERKICSNLSLTSDYIFSYYGKVKAHRIGDSNFDNGEDTPPFANPNNTRIPGGFRISSSARVYTQSVMVGIKYYFGSCCP